jgi:hypothetical protein
MNDEFEMVLAPIGDREASGVITALGDQQRQKGIDALRESKSSWMLVLVREELDENGEPDSFTTSTYGGLAGRADHTILHAQAMAYAVGAAIHDALGHIDEAIDEAEGQEEQS